MRHMWTKNQVENLVKVTKKDISSLVDSSGHSRFIVENGTPAEITGLTISYCKSSLSGTHLMCVLAGTLSVGAEVGAGVTLATFSLPSWIKNKIVGVQGSIIEYKSISVISEAFNIQNMATYIAKVDSGLAFATNSAFTSTYGGSFRMTIDLMIE